MQKKYFLLNQMIKQYVKCQEPIGSESLKISLEGKISSATIRNYFKILGQEGVIVQTHISSGRIPTDLALRNYWRELLSPANLMPHINTARLHALCNDFRLTCVIKPIDPQKLLRVLEVEQSTLVLVFERDCVAIPFTPSMARFTQELIGVQSDDIQKIASDVCAKSLSQALKALDSAADVYFFGLSFLCSLLEDCSQTALKVLQGEMFGLLDDVVFFPQSSQHIIIAHRATFQDKQAKMLCIGRLNQDYEGFYEALQDVS